MSEKSSYPSPLGQHTSMVSASKKFTTLTPASSPSSTQVSQEYDDISRLTQREKSTGLEWNREKKLHIRERVWLFAKKELDKLKHRMPRDVFQKHIVSMEALLLKFEDDTSKIEDTVKTQLQEIEKQVIEKNPDVPYIIAGLQWDIKTGEFSKILQKTESLSDPELTFLEKTLQANHEKRAIFVKKIQENSKFFQKILKSGGKGETLFASLSTTVTNGLAKVVSGFNKDDMVSHFQKQEQSLKDEKQLKWRLENLHRNLSYAITSIQKPLNTGNIDAFVAWFQNKKPELIIASKQYATIAQEAKIMWLTEIADTAWIASKALKDFSEIPTDTLMWWQKYRNELDGNRKKNILSELQVRCQIAIAGLSGNIALLAFKDKQNTYQTAASLEATIKNEGIEKVSSIAFAEYLVQLSHHGKLNLWYLQNALWPETLRNFGYLWRIQDLNDSKDSKVETNAQRRLKEMWKEWVKQEFGKVLIAAFDLEDSKFQLKKGGDFPQTKTILTTVLKFSPRESNEIIERIQASQDPYSDLVSILALGTAKNSSDMSRMIEELAKGIAEDNKTSLKYQSKVLQGSIETTLNSTSAWRWILDTVKTQGKKWISHLHWHQLMSEVKKPGNSVGIDVSDDWFFHANDTVENIFKNEVNLHKGKSLLKKYRWKGLLKEEYVDTLETFFKLLEATNTQKKLDGVKNSTEQQQQILNAVEAVVRESKKQGTTLTPQNVQSITNTVLRNTKFSEKMEAVVGREAMQQIINEAPDVFKKLLQDILNTDGSKTAKKLLEILERSPREFQNTLLTNSTYQLFFLDITSWIHGNPQIDAFRLEIANIQRKQLTTLSQEELQTYSNSYIPLSTNIQESRGSSNNMETVNGTNEGTKGNIQYLTNTTDIRHISPGTTLSFSGSSGLTEISMKESGELIIETGDRTTTIDKKYASAALVSIEVANTIGFPELVQNIDFFITEMKHDPLFERILDGANEQEEVLVAKKLASTIGLKYDDSMNTPTQLYSSIENNRILLPGAPSVQFIALQNGIIGNNSRIRREVFIDRLKNPLITPAA